MFETEHFTQEDCIIVHVDPSHITLEEHRHRSRDQDRSITEIQGLATAINLDILRTHTIKPKRIDPGRFFGSGQRDIVIDMAEDLKPDVIIVNTTLSPIQQRNLEREWKAKIIDRTGLILEIFGARAQTKEGRLQVDLAMLEYQKSRLVRSWTHLERQRGGAGFMGGPGETQIEIDRRLIAEKITRLKREIAKIAKMRDLGREARARVPFPMVALVGYTNAGKSTLFNTLTGAEVMAKDMVFATLDPTMRRLKLPEGQDVILADTVGFITDLPTHLIAAFRSTLEQVLYADVILHVMDVSHDGWAGERADVICILEDLGIDYKQDARVIEVWNKLDIAAADTIEDAQRAAGLGKPASVMMSALTGQGDEALFAAIDSVLQAGSQIEEVTLPAHAGKAIAWLYANASVIERVDEDACVRLNVKFADDQRQKFDHYFGDIKISA